MKSKLLGIPLRMLYKALDGLDPLLERLNEWVSYRAMDVHKLWWISQMPRNVHMDKEGIVECCCPFCYKGLEYRIDFDGISVGVCWDCKKAWYETWDICDCPDYDNCAWPTKDNCLSDVIPSAFWKNVLGHAFRKKDGLLVDEGEFKPLSFNL